MRGMKWAMALALALSLVVAVLAGPVRGVDLGDIKVDPEDVKNFYRAVGEYFGLLDKDVDRAHTRGLPDSDLPTLFMISRNSGVDWNRVADYRLGGKSWSDVCRHFNVSPEIFFVELKEYPSGPPYGNAYGYWKNKDKVKWKDVTLSDDDFINLSNLKFVSEHYKWDPDDVVKQRAAGKDFVNINKDVKTKAQDKADKDKAHKNPADKSKGPKDKSPGKNKDADKGAGKSKGGDKGGGGKSKGGGGGSGGGGGGGKSKSGGGGGGGGKGPK